MKKFLLFLTVLVMLISCSKDLNNEITFKNDGQIETKGADFLPKIVSLDTTDLCKYLNKSPLTDHEKDSIAKVALLSVANAKGPIYGTIKGESPEYTDYSGYIHLKVFYETTSSKIQHPVLSKSVTSDYAMVGGGALAWGYTGNGAFLTESRPVNATTWQGQSKDNIIVDPHYLTVYVIGMRIDSVDPSYL